MHPVHFVGAGPGDPELITVKGQRLLREAEVIVYTGSLVPKALLQDLAAELHNSAGLNLDQVMEIVITARQQGKRVVRLHTGDPAIYGAINEQIARLVEEDIPFQVVPGVSSATASAAALGSELTLPEVSQTVIITRRAGRTPVPEKEDLVSLAGHQATMLILLSVGMIEQVVADLLAGGYTAATQVAVVEKVSWPEQRIIRGTLATIAGQVKEAGITKTAIIAVGEVLAKAPPPALSKLYDKGFSHGFRQGLD
ncbi:MAG TPA: precorrin-4 C(11)-methyltransferase [Deltaproteobacteria bacterium]|nr:precorrin-4 C(11)-methyltransferase [Deltaproteobacteria bacterium]